MAGDLQEPLLTAQPARSRLVVRAAVITTVVVLAILATAVVVMHLGSNQAAADIGQGNGPSSEWGGERLRIVNMCDKDPLWITGFSVAVPIFSQDPKLAAGESLVVPIPDEGLSSTRFWAKWGCDDSGQACKIGQSGGPGESCGPLGCAPPIDSKFEATFGCMPGTKDCAHNPSLPSEALGPIDWWDVSQVDGWTLPYRVDVYGECAAPTTIDCSSLALSSCPRSEFLGSGYGTQSLHVVDPDDSDVSVGCYSPCGKLTFSQWGQGFPNTPDSKAAQDYCCPTPPIDPSACSSGPVISTEYVKAVHSLCPSVYAYAYDDGVGLSQCPAGTGYKVTFYCPS